MNHMGPFCPTHHLHKSLIIFLCILSISLSAIGKPKEEYSLPVPPTPTPERVEVFVGESKTITLKASGRIEEPIKFFIRKKPSKGTLGAIQPVDSKSAEVDYTSDPSSKAGEDFFTYAAQSIDSPVSAAARMEIDLRLRPAVLVYPRLLDFGTVSLGDSKQIDLVISNAGGKAAALDMSINSPWRFAEPPSNGVAGGGEVLIALVFEPRSPGDYSERLAITRDGSEVVTLRGSGMDAFSWPSQGLLISSEMRAGAQAMIPFTNRTGADRIVEFEWPGNIIAPRALRIPAGETMQVPVALDASTPPSFSTRSTVPFRSGNFTA